MNSIQTTCGYCGCGCNFYLDVERDAILSVTPKPDHPVSQGMLCSKGWLGHGFVRHPDRLHSPRVRLYDGTHSDVCWDETLNLTAAKLLDIKAKHGPGSFAFLTSARCTNEENYLAAKFTRAVMGSPHIDHCARL